jgi:hypothetical protein
MDDFLKLFLEKLQAYQAKWGQVPDACFYPQADWDALQELMREKSSESLGSKLYWDTYLAMRRGDCIFVYGVALYRSMVSEIDFSSPRRSWDWGL